MKKLKIVRVITASYVVPWHLHNTLNRISADFQVCVIGQEVSNNQAAYPNVKFVDIDINRKTSLFADGLALFQLCRFLLSYKPDIIHSVMPKAGLLSALAGFICRVPVRLHTFTGQTWVAKAGYSRHFYYWIDRLINALNTACLTDSFSQSTFLQEHGITDVGKPLSVLSQGSLSGVDVSKFDLSRIKNEVQDLRIKLAIDDRHFVFAYIARKTQAKGAHDMLEAFSRIVPDFPHAKLLFVGPDEDGEIAKLHTTIPDLFTNVIDVGHVTNHEVYLAFTDVLCLPSYREGFGSIIIDAAAMGVPAIGSRIPGLTDSITDLQTGLLFSAGNVAELTGIMTRFINDSELRDVLGRRAKERVDEFFTADKLYEALKQYYFEQAKKNRCIRRKRGAA